MDEYESSNDILGRIEKIMNENRVLNKQNAELKAQLDEAKSEIISLHERLAIYEKITTEADNEILNSDAFKSDEIIAFCKLSPEELSLVENESTKESNYEPTPFSEFKFGMINGKCIIRKYIGKGGDIVIPKGVTGIGMRAFCYYSSIWSVVITNGVDNIEGYAFANCKNLSSVTISSSVKRIGCNAFFGCKKLKDISIQSGVITIGSWAFAGCTSIIEINIPDSVKRIDNYAFRDCINLKLIFIPDSVEEFGNYVFVNCSNLTICCSGKSTARRYAEKHGISYKLID